MSPSVTPRRSQKTTRPSQVDGLPTFDPTDRAIDNVLREVSATREIIEAQIQGINDGIETRLKERDKAIQLLQHQLDKIPDLVVDRVMQLQTLHQEKFGSIGTQFAERDTRTEQTSRDSKVAVDAALQAAKEAVGEQNKSNALAISKSEAAFTKQIDQIGVLVNSMQKAIDDKIEDIKVRLQVMESVKKGQGDIWNIWFGVTGLIIAVASVGVATVAIFFSRGH